MSLDIIEPGKLVELVVTTQQYRAYVATQESLITIFHDQVILGTLLATLFWCELDDRIRESVDKALYKDTGYGRLLGNYSYGVGARYTTHVVLVSSTHTRHTFTPVVTELVGRVVAVPSDSRFAEVKTSNDEW